MEREVRNLRDQIKARQAETTDSRVKLETAQETVTFDEPGSRRPHRRGEQASRVLTEVTRQAAEFKLQKTHLDQEIVLLKRDLEVAIQNNKNLREKVVAFQNALKKANLSADFEAYKALELPPDVEGQVLKSRRENSRIEISIGSNDGLGAAATNSTCTGRRRRPTTSVRCASLETDPNHATARVIGKTLYGKKIQEGDNVTTKIRPRG